MTASDFNMRHRVEFAQTDMAGIMHFSHFFCLMERTEHAFFRSLGLAVHQEVEGETIGWPRVDASCSYLSPLRFEDEVEIQLRVEELGKKSIRYRYQFHKVGADGGLSRVVARGSITTVCARVTHSESGISSVAIPEIFRRKICPATPENSAN